MATVGSLSCFNVPRRQFIANSTELGRLLVTRVVRCGRYGVARPESEPLLERKYRTVDEARAGHDEAVNAFAEK